MKKETKYQKKVHSVMHKWKIGTLKSGGQKITNQKQAIAIALSEAGRNLKIKK